MKYNFVLSDRQHRRYIIWLLLGQPWPNHDVWFMNESISKDSFYVAETNYDRLKAPPEFDDRRYPMENCLEKVLFYDIFLFCYNMKMVNDGRIFIRYTSICWFFLGWYCWHQCIFNMENFKQQPNQKWSYYFLYCYVCREWCVESILIWS